MSTSLKASVPLYYQVKEQLKEKIQQGKIKPGSRLYSEYKLVEKYNFSRNTARQALTSLVNEGYAFRVHGKGTFASLKIPAQADNKTNSIGFILCNRKFDHPVYSKTLRGIDNVSRNNQKHLVFSELENFTTKHQLPFMITERAVDGVVITGLVSQQILDSLENIKMPYVLIGVMRPDNKKFIVISDHKDDASSSIQCLLDNGHRNIAFINGKFSYLQYRELEAGVKKSLNKAGVIDDCIIKRCESFSEHEAFTKMKQILESKKTISAVFVANPDMTIGAIKAIENAGLKIPEDISIIGYGSSEYMKQYSQTTTMMEVNSFETARRAASILLKVINKEPEVPKTTMIKASLSLKESVKNITTTK